MGLYKQIFTLREIFSNRELQSKLPYIRYKEILNDNEELVIRTNVKRVKTLAFANATRTARKHINPLETTKVDNKLILQGKIQGNIEDVVSDIKNNLNEIRSVLSYTANNANMIREGIKESESIARANNQPQKLYLKISSLQEIKLMNYRQLEKFMQDVMENLYYGSGYEKTQKKYNVSKQEGFIKPYEQRQEEWRKKVGLI